MKLSKLCASFPASCAPFTIARPSFSLKVVCAPRSFPKNFNVYIGGRANALDTSTRFVTFVLIPFPRPSILD